MELAKKEEIVLICGHYEGFDERIPGYKYRKIGKESKEDILNKMEQEVQSWE